MTKRYKFANWEFDKSSGELSNKQGVKRLEPIVANLLDVLLNNAQRVVTRDELIEKVWKNRIVSDDPINRSISILRQTLSPSNKQAFIKTVPKRGYIANFGDVTIEQAPTKDELEKAAVAKNVDIKQTETAAAAPSKKRRPILFVLASLVFIFAFVVAYQRFTYVPLVIDNPRIAVLPFSDLSNRKNHDYLAEGMSDSLIHLVGRVPDIEVIARTSSFSYYNLPISQLADELRADYVVEGSIQIVEEKIRVIARLIDTRTESEIWSLNVTRNVADIFAVQDEMASALVVSLKGNVLLNVQQYQPRYEVYQMVLQGIALADAKTTNANEKAIDLFRQAIEADPEYALPHIWLARVLRHSFNTNTYAQLYPSQAKERLLEEVENALETAINLDPLSSEAHNLQALMSDYFRRNEKAEAAFERAIELNPNNATALNDFASWLQKNGRTEDALKHARKAHDLRPNSTAVSQLLATVLWSLGRQEEAVSIIKTNIDLQPNASRNYSLLSRWTTQMGQPGQALLYAMQERDLDPSDPNKQWIVCLAHYQLWDKEKGHECSRKLLASSPNYTEALTWLNYDDFEAVKKIIMKKTEDYPNSAYFRLQLAAILMHKEQPQKIIDLLEPFFPQLFVEEPKIDDWSLWAVKLIGHAWMEQGRTLQAEKLLSYGIKHVEKNRRFMGGGFSSGIDDIHFLMVLGEEQEALIRLKAAVDSRWSFYSMSLPTDKLYDSVRDNPIFIELLAKQTAFMKQQREWAATQF